MTTLYTSPTKLMTSILVHQGNFAVNQIDGGTTPTEFVNLADSTNYSNYQFAVNTDGSIYPFTHFDASVMQAANYDEIIIDILPIVTYNPVL
jgi:hypothetical protein